MPNQFTGVMPIPQLRDIDIYRFWTKVGITAIEDRCWEWEAGKRRRGYGRFTITVSTNKDKGFVSTRVAYFLANGIDPAENLVCHSCDNPSCCNPKHLFLGTSKDNTQDMLKKGRTNTRIGAEHGMAKLTAENVLDIRERVKNGSPQNEVAKIYNIHQGAVSNIIRRVSWKHI